MGLLISRHRMKMKKDIVAKIKTLTVIDIMIKNVVVADISFSRIFGITDMVETKPRVCPRVFFTV